jgi:hypothetical protein
MSAICRACGAENPQEVAFFASQPVASHFKQSAEMSDELYDLKVLGCPRCGLVQLESLPPLEALRPRFEWLRYNEPETHLDKVAAAIASKAPRGGLVVGLTYKDDSLLARLDKLGFDKTTKDITATALADAPRPWGIETVADWLSSGRGAGAVEGASVVVSRHVLEHCENPRAALGALFSWVADDGFLVVEVPGCREALQSGIPELLWEEHASYFTADALQQMISSGGGEIVDFAEHTYPFESSLVALVRKAPAVAVPERGDAGALAADFGRKLKARVDATARDLRRRQEEGKRTVIFGAGHLSCAFASFSGAANAIECVLDDTPHKQGMFLAGTQLPIMATDALASGEPGLCLMAVHPSVEEKVFARLAPLRDAGWETKSIFPDSPYGIDWN